MPLTVGVLIIGSLYWRKGGRERWRQWRVTNHEWAVRVPIQYGRLSGKNKTPSWNCLGDAYDRLGRYSQAEEAFKKAIDLGPPDPVDLVATWYSLGIVYAEERKKLGVMDVYRHLKTLDQNYADRFFQQYVQPVLNSSDR